MALGKTKSAADNEGPGPTPGGTKKRNIDETILNELMAYKEGEGRKRKVSPSRGPTAKEMAAAAVKSSGE